MVYADTIWASTAYDNARYLLRDSYGKLLLATRSGQGGQALHASWSNDGGSNWTNTVLPCGGCDVPTWALDSAHALNLVYAKPGH